MMRSMRTLTIAAAQPHCVPKDLRRNALEHASVVRQARADLVVFPELSLTGYELDADQVSVNDPALEPLIDACAQTGCVALVGAPVADFAGRPRIATLRASGSGVGVAYLKTYLGGEEATRFFPGDGPVALDVVGWRVGIGICKDPRRPHCPRVWRVGGARELRRADRRGL